MTRLERLTHCGVDRLAELLGLERDKNAQLKQQLGQMELPREVQAIHVTQEELSTLGAVLKLRRAQWALVSSEMERQKLKQRGGRDQRPTRNA